MICPQCGNTITMQEYRCSKCNLDLHCSTPEGRQKAEQYANQMYASGKWKVRQPVQSITDIPKPEEKPKVVYEKPKRNPFKIATIILAITTVAASLMFAVMFAVARQIADESNALIAESEQTKAELQSANERIEELEKPITVWHQSFEDSEKNVFATISVSPTKDKSLSVVHYFNGDYYKDLEAYKQDVISSYSLLCGIMEKYDIKNVNYSCLGKGGENDISLYYKDGELFMAFGSEANGERTAFTVPQWFKDAVDDRANMDNVLPQAALNFPWFMSTYNTIGDMWRALE